MRILFECVSQLLELELGLPLAFADYSDHLAIRLVIHVATTALHWQESRLFNGGTWRLNGVIVLGATNRSEDLDKALLRPGRFDTQVNDAH